MFRYRLRPLRRFTHSRSLHLCSELELLRPATALGRGAPAPSRAREHSDFDRVTPPAQKSYRNNTLREPSAPLAFGAELLNRGLPVIKKFKPLLPVTSLPYLIQMSSQNIPHAKAPLQQITTSRRIPIQHFSDSVGVRYVFELKIIIYFIQINPAKG